MLGNLLWAGGLGIILHCRLVIMWMLPVALTEVLVINMWLMMQGG
jgi:hypothetical protein